MIQTEEMPNNYNLKHNILKAIRLFEVSNGVEVEELSFLGDHEWSTGHGQKVPYVTARIKIKYDAGEKMRYPECIKQCYRSCFQCPCRVAALMEMDDEYNALISRLIAAEKRRQVALERG
jgi:hypothetical protein